jgi:hypothetical protein
MTSTPEDSREIFKRLSEIQGDECGFPKRDGKCYSTSGNEAVGAPPDLLTTWGSSIRRWPTGFKNGENKLASIHLCSSLALWTRARAMVIAWKRSWKRILSLKGSRFLKRDNVFSHVREGDLFEPFKAFQTMHYFRLWNRLGTPLELRPAILAWRNSFAIDDHVLQIERVD